MSNLLFKPGGGGSSGTGDPYNYLTGANTNAAGGVGSWVTYADAAGVAPTDGTGGAPTVTLTSTTTTAEILRGTASFKLSKGASNLQGNGCSITLPVQNFDKGNLMQFSLELSATSPFVYNFTSGGATYSDVTIWFYDVTNSLLFQPANYQINASGKVQALFQMPTNCSSIRPILHISGTNASAYDFIFDDVYFGPIQLQSVNADSDWVAYTPTFTGFGTVSAVEFEYKKEGPDLLVRGKFTSGTSTATEARVSLPTNLTSGNTTIIPSIQQSGNGVLSAVSANQFIILIEPSVTYVTFGLQATGTSGLTKQLGNAYISSGQTLSINARVPIQGWTSGNLSAFQTNQNTPVIFRANKMGGAVTANTTIPTWTNTLIDTVGAFNATTGQYTVKIPGSYRASFLCYTTSGNPVGDIRKNGTTVAYGVTGNSSASLNTTILENLVVNDIITVTLESNLTLLNDVNGNIWSMELIKGPNNNVAPIQTIACRYYASATSISNSLATVVWTTTDFDTNTAMVSGVYTVPSPGEYQVNCNIQVTGTIALNSELQMQLQKNSTSVTEFQTYAGGAMTAQNGQISDIIRCVAGDTIRIQLRSSATLPTISSSNTKNFISINKVGSY